MLRYKNRRPQLIISMTLLSLILTTSLIAIIVRALDKLDLMNLIDLWQGLTPSGLTCDQLCPDKPILNGLQLCCNELLDKCLKKSVCFDESIADFEKSIEDDNMAIIYTIVPACVVTVLIIALTFHWCRLRKDAYLESRRMLLQEALIGHDENSEYNIEEEESFQSYNEFIQYLIDTGYIDPDMLKRKRQSSKIKDSFDTVDNDNCSICIQQFSEQKVLQLDCEHKFHSQCIRDWNVQNPTCPICRAEIESE